MAAEGEAVHVTIRPVPQDHEYRVPRAPLRLPSPKQPDSLLRFLTDEQMRLLRDDLDARFEQARSHSARRNAALDRADFYLIWRAGLRVGEVEGLSLEDLDLGERKLMMRRGKGSKDRPVYLTDKTMQTLQAYLAARGTGGATSHHLPLPQPAAAQGPAALARQGRRQTRRRRRSSPSAAP
ncbi:MAG: tyrosine-type recombinase/integrase [Chloroflexi bacterium]|nr:tyrosine-type recombinase/integrase [Chloroflexota bacterium]